jgi:DNA-binding CsgD family transcriptional regulator
MTEQDSINEIFMRFLMEYKFDEKDLDYSITDKHVTTLETLSNIGSSGYNLFDINKRKVLFYSSNFGQLLGYVQTDYVNIGQQFFTDKIHPDDKLKLSLQGISTLKILNSLSSEEKLIHKEIKEFRMLNAQNKYVRLIEQYQIIELDKKGQIWLLMGVVDISPNQEEFSGIKVQLLNFKTGHFIPLDTPPKAQIELTKREIEILKLVKEGYLSKEISSKLFISLHTVNTHRQRFLVKLGAQNSMEAINFASNFGLIG